MYVRVCACTCACVCISVRKGKGKMVAIYDFFSLPFWCHSLFGSCYTRETRTFGSIFSFFPYILVQMEQVWVFVFWVWVFFFLQL